MAKTYIDIVKYMVEAKFDITGSVEKPDIIGAVFGQTEGLLGSDLDLRELQKNGKIGRIEIDSSTAGNKTYGKLFLPSSLGRVETCILAAAIESVDRVGPFETEFKILKIEDTRNEKRKKILTRAKELVKNLLITELPDSREISDLVEADVKTSTVGVYGPESLPAGPDIEKAEEVILVEGRADVINLLKNDIGNCIAVGGAAGSIPKTIISLCSAKESTLFVDGDRGGEMIIRNITSMADIDYVAKAPDGKEVEELTRKEIIKSLRSRIPIEQIIANNKRQAARQEYQNNSSRNDFVQRRQNERMEMQQEQRDRREQQAPSTAQPGMQQRGQQKDVLSPTDIISNLSKRPGQEPAQKDVLSPTDIISNLNKRPAQGAAQNASRQYVQETEESSSPRSFGIKNMEGETDEDSMDAIPQLEQMPSKGPAGGGSPGQTFISSLNELKNTLRGRLYGSDGSVINEIPIRELIQTVQSAQGISAIVFDGIITQRLVDLSYKQGVREIYGVRASQITRRYSELMLYTTEHGVM
jgi:DNA primase